MDRITYYSFSLFIRAKEKHTFLHENVEKIQNSNNNEWDMFSFKLKNGVVVFMTPFFNMKISRKYDKYYFNRFFELQYCY